MEVYGTVCCFCYWGNRRQVLVFLLLLLLLLCCVCCGLDRMKEREWEEGKVVSFRRTQGKAMRAGGRRCCTASFALDR